jgi:8-oxo-dGTP diphosphatase
LDFLPKAACVLLQKDGLILAVSRKSNSDDFGMPGGKVDSGETVEQAARRELKEETGLDAGTLRKLYSGACESETPGLIYWTTTYVAEDFEGELRTREKGVVKWVRPVVLLRGTFRAYNQNVFVKAGIDTNAG